MLPVFLEGSLLAHVLAAEGLLVLHASAVELGGAALAIVGPSGMGEVDARCAVLRGRRAARGR